MRHQPALITCLHSRPCFWTLGPRPLSIVPTISVPFRYHTTIVNSPIGPRTHLASPLLLPHCSPLIPNRFSYLSRYSSSIVLCNSFVPHSDNVSHSTIVPSSIYTLPVASPGPHLDLLVFGPRYAPVCIRYSLLTLGLWAQSLTFASVLTAAALQHPQDLQVVASCRVEP